MIEYFLGIVSLIHGRHFITSSKIQYSLAAHVIGRLAERGLERSVRTSIIPFLVGALMIYVCGVAWLAVFLGSSGQALVAGFLPFLIGDAIKLVAASLALPAVWKLVGQN